MGHPSPSALGLLNAAVYISGLCTAPFAAFVADRFGRRWCVQYTAWTKLLGTVVECAAGTGRSSGYGMFFSSRIICGSGFHTSYIFHLLCLCSLLFWLFLEMQEIKDTLDYEKTHHASSWKAMFGTNVNRHRLACVLLIACCQNLSGTAIISYYYTNILALAGITAPQQTTGIKCVLSAPICLTLTSSLRFPMPVSHLSRSAVPSWDSG